ncbi:MAG: HEPN domain-containing protein [Bacteroidota bacterium]
MKSFRTELEDPIVEKDILELERKIHAFQKGQVDEERFRSLRLARGVYGQRQEGVQMVRIKIPFGKLDTRQLRRIADISDEYASSNLHITTRQDIQVHYVSLDHTPELWAELEKDKITLREACGNTVRNITGSPLAGIDPKEPFDISPYAEAVFQYFLRNPICQDMGRKFKISFSSSDLDDSYSFVHDLGFIPKIRDGVRGFKVMLGGGIGSQPKHAETAFEFLPVEQIVPFTESVLRVFDQYGERARRHKARLKYLLKDVGLEGFRKLVAEQQQSLAVQSYPIQEEAAAIEVPQELETVTFETTPAYETWRATNALPQKQEGYFAVGIKLTNGDISSDKARKLANIIDRWASKDLRLTIQQNILLRHVPEAHLPALYLALDQLDLANPGYESPLDIVACPGTDTCNLGIASSMGLARELERVLQLEFPALAHDKDLVIKISGCMNACGQHTLASIGFQGMTVKAGKLIAPASQLLLGGGTLGNGQGRFADKVLKMPARRSPEALRRLLNDYQSNREEAEFFHSYYDRREKDYFYQMLKDLSTTDNLTELDFTDWGNEEKYIRAIGIGECAGVTVDLVATLLLEAQEKLENAEQALGQERYADAIYWTYTAMLYAAKGLLTPTDAKLNTQQAIIRAFDEHFTTEFDLGESFSNIIRAMKTNEPTADFAEQYLRNGQLTVSKVEQIRQSQLEPSIVE